MNQIEDVLRFAFLVRLSFCALLFLATLSAFAHDPYEITSTFSIHTNRSEMRIELEYRAAASLAGAMASNEGTVTFEKMRPALKKVAGGFYRITANGKEVLPDDVNVSLDVENHVRLNVSYPSVAGQTVAFDAVALKTLSS